MAENFEVGKESGSYSQEIAKDWQLSREARIYMNPLIRRKKRVLFGLLEHPSFVSPLMKKAPVHHCKMFLYGKAAIGKTSTVMKLAGQHVPRLHQETLGVQTTTIYWPAKLMGPQEHIELMQIEFWDTGERALRKFEHILPSCLSGTNCIAFLFSYADRNSWLELPNIITQATATGKIDSHLKIVIATRADSSEYQVTQEEVEQFEQEHNISVLSICNVNNWFTSEGALDGQKEIEDVTVFLNTLTKLILEHKKRLYEDQFQRKLKENIEVTDV